MNSKNPLSDSFSEMCGARAAASLLAQANGYCGANEKLEVMNARVEIDNQCGLNSARSAQKPKIGAAASVARGSRSPSSRSALFFSRF